MLYAIEYVTEYQLHASGYTKLLGRNDNRNHNKNADINL